MSEQAKKVAVDVLSMRMDPKLKYLASVAARYRGQTLSAFIETAVKQALSPVKMLADEPAPGTEIVRHDEPLWNEALWSEDEAERVFLLAVGHPDLLRDREKDIWTCACTELAKSRERITLKNFCGVYQEVA